MSVEDITGKDTTVAVCSEHEKHCVTTYHLNTLFWRMITNKVTNFIVYRRIDRQFLVYFLCIMHGSHTKNQPLLLKQINELEPSGLTTIHYSAEV